MKNKQNILVIGGTAFLGRAIVDALLAKDHQVTIFHRGKTNPDIFPNVQSIIGDRDSEIEKLKGHHWDAVIDTCGYLPRIVEKSAKLLSKQVKSYVFISTLSVYADPSHSYQKEDAPLGILDDPATEIIDGETYGPLKALCEKEVLHHFGACSLIIRPGLIVGPHDYSDRFNYWIHRFAQGGDVLAPGKAERPIQFIDVRDLAEWICHLVEEEQGGVFNANGRPDQITMKDYLGICASISEKKSKTIWVDEAFLLSNDVTPWMEMPLWMPESDPNTAGFFKFDVSKALQSELQIRPFHETIEDTAAWLKTRPEDHHWRAGITHEKEKKILQLWNLEQNRQ